MQRRIRVLPNILRGFIIQPRLLCGTRIVNELPKEGIQHRSAPDVPSGYQYASSLPMFARYGVLAFTRIRYCRTVDQGFPSKLLQDRSFSDLHQALCFRISKMQVVSSRSAQLRAPGTCRRVSRARVAVVKAAKTADGPRVAIVGITGAVGQEFLTVLKERNFPYSDMKMLASARSAGQKQEFEGHTYTVEELTENSFKDVDIALFSAGGSISKKFGPIAVKDGAIVVDNSSAFRMTEGVPLVIPEVNPEAMSHIKVGKGGAIIANPNCSTIIALMAVTPLHRLATVKRMCVSTYQAASGAGAAAMEELRQQTRDVLDGKPAQPKIFPLQYAFNLFSHNSGMDVELGYNEEEMKLVKETRKIWSYPAVRITGTCVRVPVMRAHAETINLEFEKDISEAQALEALAAFPGVSIINDRKNNRFPTPLDATTKDDVFVGRIRRDISRDDNKGLDLFVCGDQIKKGAALNAVQIAELLL